MDKRCCLPNIDLEAESADLVIIPNLIHHVGDQYSLFSEVKRILRKGGLLYIFEPLVREIHQMPDDFLRYTPYGLKNYLENFDFIIDKTETIGGPFEVISYCWQQALQYLPEEVQSKYKEWFFKEHNEELKKLGAKYQYNLVKSNSSFPTAFSVLAHKK